DEISSVALKVRDLFVGVSARDDLDPRVGNPPLLDDLAGLEPVRDGDQQGARRCQICRGKDLRGRAVALQGFDSAGPQFGDQLLLLLDDQERQLLSQKLLTHPASDAAVADEYQMISRPSSSANRWPRAVRPVPRRHWQAAAARIEDRAGRVRR